jgi:hypothetical protein
LHLPPRPPPLNHRIVSSRRSTNGKASSLSRIFPARRRSERRHLNFVRSHGDLARGGGGAGRRHSRALSRGPRRGVLPPRRRAQRLPEGSSRPLPFSHLARCLHLAPPACGVSIGSGAGVARSATVRAGYREIWLPCFVAGLLWLLRNADTVRNFCRRDRGAAMVLVSNRLRVPSAWATATSCSLVVS